MGYYDKMINLLTVKRSGGLMPFGVLTSLVPSFLTGS